MSWHWLLIGLLGSLQLPASPPAAGRPRDGQMIISGRVVQAGTNQAIGGAQVTLQPTSMSTMTDMNGQFQFTGPSGRYTLTVERDGFVPRPDPLRSISELGMSLTLGSGQVRNDLLFSMYPAPAISGNTFYPNGEPLAAAVVHAYRWRYTPFGRRMRIVRTALSDDTGAFRLFWLPFGEYFVAANYNKNAQARALGPIKLSPNVPNPDDGFPTVYYNGATRLADAEKIRLAPGAESTGFNVVFRDVKRFNIHGRVVAPSMPLPPDLKVMFVPEGSEIIADDRNSFVNHAADGTFTVSGVSPGTYVLYAVSGPCSPEMVPCASDLIPVTVGDTDVNNVTIPLVATLGVRGRITVEGMLRANHSGTRVSLVRATREVDLVIKTEAASDGTFKLSEVGPGNYDVFVENTFPGTYARAIRFGGDVLTVPLQITPGTNVPLEITLSSGSTVQGRVVDRQGDPAPGVQVVLIPDVRFRRRPDRYAVGYTDASGMFRLSNVPQGFYSAYAFEQLEPEAYYAFAYDRLVELRFGNRATRVNTNQGQAATIELKVIPAAETAGGL